MKVRQDSSNSESKAEWFANASKHGQSKSSLQKTILPTECKHKFYNTIRAQLRQITIYGVTKTRYTMSTNQINQMSLFFNPNLPDHISICFNEMKYEVVIPYEEICKIEYYYRELNHPWMLKRILLYSDPTDGYFDEAVSLCLRPLNSKQIRIFHNFQNSPEIMNNHRNGTCTTRSELILNEVYITCIFATEKRAIFYPVDGTFYHLRSLISRRFPDKQWNKTWFRNSHGSWIKLKNEGDWNLAKSESQCGKMERVIIYFK
ncbi:25232_t:CDS:2 [Gigaspora margarita]|uniref:25232_t:CDS:1 n=1 Tax=Gigaspora margarita TaxID=4874 RepID=A0ABM8W6X8_GIGMA|nr:25232_t:CDS:2 [Gigaspora margarita]